MDIVEIRDRFSREKKLFKNKNRNRMKIPQWIIEDKEEPLKVIYKDSKKLIADGDIVLGHIIEAAPELLLEGEIDLPVTIIYSLDSQFSRGEELEELASKVKESEIFTNSLEKRIFNEKLPSSLVGDREVYMTTLILCRKHLPMRVLSRELLPVIVMPDETNASIVVPKYYW